MKKLIHKYLFEYFHIVENKVRRNQKYYTFDLPSYVIVNELEKIFGLNKKELKWYVKSWIKKRNKGFDFNKWWTPPKYQIYIPMVKKIAARTVGLDLVNVQPMEGPRGELLYMNYQYGGMDAGYVYAPYIPVIETPQVEWDRVTPDRIAARYANREVNPNFYGEINVGQPIGVSSRTQETIRRWEEAGLLDRPRVDPETGHIDLPYDVQLTEQDYFFGNFGN